MHDLLQIWFGWVQQWGYLGIILLMAMESSIIPVPSEIVIPPAAFLASQGRFNVWAVIAAGTFGSWLGAALSYWVSFWLGRIVIVKWGRLFFVSEAKLERAEHWLHRYEAGGIFFARLLPVIRHLISIPAGIIRMNFGTFSVVTIAGSALWCGVLAWFGQTAITPDMLSQDPAALAAALKSKSHIIVGAVVVLCILYFVVMRATARTSDEAR
ncbi:MAG: DedA family protein [Verrucomicrobia bacterium]|nr:DedA family protein [Verrucomicrobiota bacterium]